jgi:hypothetical protein
MELLGIDWHEWGIEESSSRSKYSAVAMEVLKAMLYNASPSVQQLILTNISADIAQIAKKHRCRYRLY